MKVSFLAKHKQNAQQIISHMVLKNPKLRFNAIFTCRIRKESDFKLDAMTTSVYGKMISKCKGMKKMDKNLQKINKCSK